MKNKPNKNIYMTTGACHGLAWSMQNESYIIHDIKTLQFLNQKIFFSFTMSDFENNNEFSQLSWARVWQLVQRFLFLIFNFNLEWPCSNMRVKSEHFQSWVHNPRYLSQDVGGHKCDFSPMTVPAEITAFCFNGFSFGQVTIRWSGIL